MLGLHRGCASWQHLTCAGAVDGGRRRGRRHSSYGGPLQLAALNGGHCDLLACANQDAESLSTQHSYLMHNGPFEMQSHKLCITLACTFPPWPSSTAFHALHPMPLNPSKPFRACSQHRSNWIVPLGLFLGSRSSPKSLQLPR